MSAALSFVRIYSYVLEQKIENKKVKLKRVVVFPHI